MKVIAFYLPQYHRIPENDAWWGEGFTEWTNVRKAKPLFPGHNQPRVPKDNNYYDLTNAEVVEWQCELAKENGIYGFCYYHYWFNGKLLLERPLEQYVYNSKVDMPFCICWANPSWTNGWVSNNDSILLRQDYGDKSTWEKHFEYLLPIISDSRYIRIDGKPLVLIFDPQSIPIDTTLGMVNLWREMAINQGLPGLSIACQSIISKNLEKKVMTAFDYRIEFQPGYTLCANDIIQSRMEKWAKAVDEAIYKVAGRKPSEAFLKRVRKYDYDAIWQALLSCDPKDEKSIPCAFTDWDNSPRRKKKARVFVGGSPDKFKKYFEQLLIKAKSQYKKDLMFITAWNEWGEGCYLEPDEQNGDGYLRAIKEVLLRHDEFPDYHKENKQ